MILELLIMKLYQHMADGQTVVNLLTGTAEHEKKFYLASSTF